MVADAELTGTWEKALAQIEGHTLDPESFMLSIREYTGKVTGEILRLKFPEPSSRAFTCPKCKTGNVIVKAKVAKCDHEGCGLLVFRRFLNKELTDQHLEQLFSSGSTRLIKGVKGKKGASFDAAVAFDADFNLKLSFPSPREEGEIMHCHSNSRQGSGTARFHPQGRALQVSGKIILTRVPVFSPKTLPVGGGPLSGP